MPIKNLLVQITLIVLSTFSIIAYAIDSDFDTLPDEWEIANNRNPNVPDYKVVTRAFVNSANSVHVCAIDDRSIFCWGGTNSSGQLDVPSILSNPFEVAVGKNHTCAIDDFGVMCWGLNNHGQTDVPDGIVNPKSLSLGEDHSCVIDDNGVTCWGRSLNNETAVPNDLLNPKVISANIYTTCAIDDNGISCWGSGFNSNNNIPEGLVNPVDISIGPTHGCALDDNGVHCWGDNNFGQTDVPDDLQNPVNIAVGYFNSCAIDDNGLQCWGSNVYKINNTPDTLSGIADVAVSLKHACALSSSGIKCWGAPDYEQDVLPELSFDPDNDGVDSSIDQLPLDPDESLDTDKDGIGNNQDTVNDLFDGKFWEVSSSNFSGSISNGTLSSNSRVSIIIKNTSTESVVLNSLQLLNYQDIVIGSTKNPNLLGNDGILSPNESFGISITTTDSYLFPLKWTLNFVNPNTEANQVLAIIKNLNVSYSNSILTLNAVGSTSRYFTLQKDSDNDRIIDIEDAFPLDPLESSDSDADGLGDNYEVTKNLNAFDADSDADGLRDGTEISLGTNPLSDDSDLDGVIDGNDRFPLISIGELLDTDSDGAPDECDEACLALGMTSDRDGIPAYTYIESDNFAFASLTPTAKVIVTGSQGDNFFDIARYVDEVSVVGQTFLFSGSSEVDGVMIQPGVKYDLTNLKGSIDKLYFSGPLSEYADSILLDTATGVMQLSRLTDIGEEIVQFIATASAADELVFTDGAISTADIKAAVTSGTPLTDLTLDTTSKALDAKTTTGATVKHIVLDNNGAGVMALGPNISTLISGSSGVDQIYVPAGSNVDASNLKSSQDEIYLQGNLADYASEFDSSGNIVLSRDVVVEDETQSERVILASGGNAATNDLVIFKDQQVDTATLKQQVLN